MTQYSVKGYVQAQKILDGLENTLVAEAIQTAILSNNAPSISPRYALGSIPSAVKSAYTNNLGTQSERFFNYGRDYHPDGLPANNQRVLVIGQTGIAPIPPYDQTYIPPPESYALTYIEAELGESIGMRFFKAAYAIDTYLLNDNFINDPDIQLHTNDVSEFTENKVSDFTIISEGTGDVYRVTDIPSFVGSIIQFIYTRIIWQYTGAGAYGWEYVIDEQFTPITSSVNLSSTNGFTSTTFLTHVAYLRYSTYSIEYWFYDQTTGLYPELFVTPEDRALVDGGAFPYAVIVDDFSKVYEDAIGEEYKDHTRNMLATIGISLADVAEAMVDPDDPGNTDDVSDAFILFAADVASDNKYTMMYLYEFFRQVHYNGIVGKYTQQDAIDDGFIEPDASNNTAFKSNRVRFDINYSFTTLTVKVGLINDPQQLPDFTTLITGPVTEVDSGNDGSTSVVNGITVGELTREIILSGVENYNPVSGRGYNNHYMVFRKQLTDSTYVELSVFGLDHYTSLYKNQGDKTFRAAVVATLSTVDNGGLFIPISHSIVNRFDNMYRHDIMVDSLQFIVHTITITRLPWYATTSFLTTLKFAFIFVSVVSFGSSEAFTKGIYAAIVHLAGQYVLGLLLVEALTLLVDVVGGDIGLIIAAVVAIYAFTLGKGEKVFDLLDAEFFMLAANSTIVATNRVTVDNFLQLEADKQDFERLVETQEAELERLDALLGPATANLDLYELVTNQDIINTYETATDFYNRSIHITNPGVLSLDMVDRYVDNLLTLPQMGNNPLNNGA